MNIAFIGLGTMGYLMAGHQQRAGHRVCVYNRTTAKAKKWVEEYGGNSAATAAAAASAADVIMLCLGNDNDVRDKVLGSEGILEGITSTNAIIVDHTTTSASLASELARALAERDIGFLDAPVSGGQNGAETRQLAVMVGGRKSHLEQATAAIKPYAKTITYMGATGAGQATKMVNQILIAGVLQGLAEGLTLAQKFNLDIATVVAAIDQGAAGSWQLTHRGVNMTKDIFNYGFAVDWMRKDLGFCLQAADELGIRLPNTEFVDRRYQELQACNFGHCDTSVLIKQFNGEEC